MKLLFLLFTVALHPKNPDRPILKYIDNNTYTIQNNSYKAIEAELDCGSEYEPVFVKVPARTKLTIVTTNEAKPEELSYCTLAGFTLLGPPTNKLP